MDFKEWLLLTEDAGDDSINIFGHPPEADEYVQASRSARDFQVFRDRLANAKKLGNPLINIDWKNFKKIPIISPESQCMPDDKPWTHKPDTAAVRQPVIMKAVYGKLSDGKVKNLE
jgi:hypothetical protein